MLQTMPAGSASPHEADDAGAVSLPGIRVLSCEDGASNQKLIMLVLRRAGAAVVDTAPNGQVGVELAMSRPYDVILMDMQMPIMDGYTAVGTLRQAGCNLPIIAMTAHAMKGEEEKCRAAGCTGYVPKPIEVDRLLQTVAELTGIRGATIQVPVRTGTVEQTPTGPLKSTLPMDDPDFREVVLEFVDRLGDRLGEIQHAWEEKELNKVAQLAHWLKGSGGTAGFGAFSAPAKKLEALAKGGELDQIASAIEELQQLASRIDVAEAPQQPSEKELRIAQP
jgi:CheY-like chemotaxis protein/HPt (histidine-containing phosphotransfer) domain-containing protein